jgi:uncharacterized repeat protein (TIGR01451 family)/MYXO-CTERM domain-containing protein
VIAGLLAATAATVATLATGRAQAANVTFDAGALIVPMDVDYQDAGMLSAFGLLDKLLRAGVPVSWCIKTPKLVVNAATGTFESDFTATAKDFKSGAAIASHGYRGGPFVISLADAAAAKPIITAWQTAHPTTAVHVATASFTANESRHLTVAPRIAVLADGSQGIAFSYLNAAGILDENGLAWAAGSADVLTPAQLAGPSATNPADGALFRPSGLPAYCELMTMHWSVTSADVPAVSAEMASFLRFPVHVNAECQAVNAIEGAPPTGGNRNFVTTKGFQWPAPKQPTSVQFSNSSLPFAQMDGPFKTIGGSEPAYALGSGSLYYDNGIVMVRGAGVPIGVQDIWMTGYAGLGCNIDDQECVQAGNSIGKVSYLGGHQYTVTTPMSTNATSQGARLFLNSLYEAGCVTPSGQPDVQITKTAPLAVSSSDVTYTLEYANYGAGPALDVVLTDPIPSGSTFVSATGGGAFAAGKVIWNLGDLPRKAWGTVSFTVKLGARGTYANTATVSFKTGLGTRTSPSNTVSTSWVSCAVDGDCPAPLVCDAAAGACVTCTPSKPSACAGLGVCLPSDRCGCATDADCGSPSSGRVCEATSQSCVDGCRGTTGNGCPMGFVCSSTTSAIGACNVPVPDAGPDASPDVGPDATTGDGALGDGGDATSDALVDAGPEIIPGGPGAPCDVDGDCTAPLVCDPVALACGASVGDAGADASAGDDGVDGAPSDATVGDTSSAADGATDDGGTDGAVDGGGSGGCGCRVAEPESDPAKLAAAAALVGALMLRRRRGRAHPRG